MPARHTVRQISGFAVHTLANAKVSLSLVPDLGARVASLRDLASGREWLDGWAPASARRLGRPRKSADYMTSSLAGIDECLPTISACRVAGRDLPDHGEVWNTPAPVDPAAASTGELVSTWKLRSLPLDFTRRITLSGATVRFAYALTNRSVRPTPFLWAWHPLFSLRKGDRLELPSPQPRKILARRGQPLPWPMGRPGCDLSRADLGQHPKIHFKGFLGPLPAGGATLRDSRGPALVLRWPAAVHPYIGLYINRRAASNLEQWAIEPTNARVDRLANITADKSPLHWLAPRETREWFVTARVGSA